MLLHDSLNALRLQKKIMQLAAVQMWKSLPWWRHLAQPSLFSNQISIADN
ncbi:hypothetical protein G6L63_06345 [Agrobacterium vitis]|nr:hypothetical protein [Agrobacterium vitis]MUZ95222.1 hypothetical protein [Agrobacterium vitis]MVA30079.1 hypothetical protein [Agrobacterium vitis]NOJ34588.1 hypothetical protein [Agrobacterium vitis]NSZ47536.1 hypothetical protein [Agrobacterium vitis]UJL72219.1 hypothetical protein AVCG412_04890 [Agrobacterium vitis]